MKTICIITNIAEAQDLESVAGVHRSMQLPRIRGRLLVALLLDVREIANQSSAPGNGVEVSQRLRRVYKGDGLDASPRFLEMLLRDHSGHQPLV